MRAKPEVEIEIVDDPEIIHVCIRTVVDDADADMVHLYLDGSESKVLPPAGTVLQQFCDGTLAVFDGSVTDHDEVCERCSEISDALGDRWWARRLGRWKRDRKWKP